MLSNDKNWFKISFDISFFMSLIACNQSSPSTTHYEEVQVKDDPSKTLIPKTLRVGMITSSKILNQSKEKMKIFIGQSG
jgi:hypothetical protein